VSRLARVGKIDVELARWFQVFSSCLTLRFLVIGAAMRPKPRVQFPGVLCHLIFRGNQRQAIFRPDADRRRYLDLKSRSPVVGGWQATARQSDTEFAAKLHALLQPHV
jgi:hypothetical protein